MFHTSEEHLKHAMFHMSVSGTVSDHGSSAIVLFSFRWLFQVSALAMFQNLFQTLFQMRRVMQTMVILLIRLSVASYLTAHSILRYFAFVGSSYVRPRYIIFHICFFILMLSFFFINVLVFVLLFIIPRPFSFVFFC